MHERYFINTETRQLYIDRHYPDRFSRHPYMEMEPDTYFDLVRLREAKRNSLQEFVRNLYLGSTVHIFGTGPSIADHAMRYNWEHAITIGVNRAPFYIPNLKYWLNTDPLKGRQEDEWIRAKKEKIPATFCSDVSFSHDELEPPCDFQFDLAKFPAATIREGLFCGTSSCTTAIDLARHMGAKRIVLWGNDFHDKNYPDQGRVGDWNMRRVVDAFEMVYRECKRLKIEVLNANPQSALKVFPFVNPVEFAHELHAPTRPVDTESRGRVLRFYFDEDTVEVVQGGECKLLNIGATGKYMQQAFKKFANDKELFDGAK